MRDAAFFLAGFIVGAAAVFAYGLASLLAQQEQQRTHCPGCGERLEAGHPVHKVAPPC